MRLFAVRESAHHHGFLHRDAMRRHRQRGPLQLPNPSSAVKDRGLLQVTSHHLDWLSRSSLSTLFSESQQRLQPSSRLSDPRLRVVPLHRSPRCPRQNRLADFLLLRRPLHTSRRLRQDRTTSPARRLDGSGIRRKPSLSGDTRSLEHSPDQPDRRQRTTCHSLHPRDRSNVQHFRSLNCTVSLGVGCRDRDRRNGYAYRDSIQHGRTEHSQQGEEEAQLLQVRKEISTAYHYRPTDRKYHSANSALRSLRKTRLAPSSWL